MIDMRCSFGMQGFYRITATRPNGIQRVLADWFPNLITDMGLNMMGNTSWLNACHVGTSNTTPTVSDTALIGFVAGTTTKYSTSYGAQSAPPYFGWKRVTYRFAAGVAAGNLAEVGIANLGTHGGATRLFSRALILDEFGSPTTITVLGDEVLDVTYEIRSYPNLTDQTGSISITGSGTHSYTSRPHSVTASHLWGYHLGSAVGFPGDRNAYAAKAGGLAAVTSLPTGGTSEQGTWTNAYVDLSLERTGGMSWSLDKGNIPTGIRSLTWNSSLGGTQCEFDPVIDKTNTKTLVMTFKVSWDRYVL